MIGPRGSRDWFDFNLHPAEGYLLAIIAGIVLAGLSLLFFP